MAWPDPEKVMYETALLRGESPQKLTEIIRDVSADSARRIAALSCLGEVLSSEELIPMIHECLDGPDTALREEAAFMIVSLDRKDPALTQKLRTLVSIGKLKLVNVLKPLAFMGDETILPQCVALIQNHSSEPPGIIATVALGILNTPESNRALQDFATNNEDPQVRLVADIRLVLNNDKAAAERLEARLPDGDWYDRLDTAFTLANFGSRKGILTAREILDQQYDTMADDVEFALIEFEEIWFRLDEADDDQVTRKQLIADWLDEKLATGA